jgi:hypothetical protein
MMADKPSFGGFGTSTSIDPPCVVDVATATPGRIVGGRAEYAPVQSNL